MFSWGYNWIFKKICAEFRNRKWYKQLKSLFLNLFIYLQNEDENFIDMLQAVYDIATWLL